MPDLAATSVQLWTGCCADLPSSLAQQCSDCTRQSTCTYAACKAKHREFVPGFYMYSVQEAHGCMCRCNVGSFPRAHIMLQAGSDVDIHVTQLPFWSFLLVGHAFCQSALLP